MNAAQEKSRILVAEDHEGVRMGIVRELSRDDELRVVGDVADGAALLQLLGKTHSELVVLDLSMPGMGGLDVRTDAGLVQFAREMDEAARGRSLPGVTSGHADGPTGRSVGGHSA